MKKIYLAFSILLIAGCAAHPPDEGDSGDFAYISAGIEERTNYSLRQTPESGQFEFPEWVTLDDGLSQDEAVALALWNNAQFQADLAALGFARADLLEANMLKNPVFSILFPVSPKLLETALDIPIDVLWQRPHRIAADTGCQVGCRGDILAEGYQSGTAGDPNAGRHFKGVWHRLFIDGRPLFHISEVIIKCLQRQFAQLFRSLKHQE